eukprot:2926268-Rhodomonas_salina.1
MEQTRPGWLTCIQVCRTRRSASALAPTFPAPLLAPYAPSAPGTPTRLERQLERELECLSPKP